MRNTRRRDNLLRNLYKKARFHKLGDIAQQISALLCALLVVGAFVEGVGLDVSSTSSGLHVAKEAQKVVLVQKPDMGRGNTGK